MHIESRQCSTSSWPLRPLRCLRAGATQSARRSCTLNSDGLLRSMHIESRQCSTSSWPLRPLRCLRAGAIQSARRSCTLNSDGLLRSMHIESRQCSTSSWPLRPLRCLRAGAIQSARRSCTRRCSGIKTSVGQVGRPIYQGSLRSPDEAWAVLDILMTIKAIPVASTRDPGCTPLVHPTLQWNKNLCWPGGPPDLPR